MIGKNGTSIFQNAYYNKILYKLKLALKKADLTKDVNCL